MPVTANAWLFQSSPTQYDLPGALTTLRALTWLVNQYEHEIRAGDPVFLWETGPQAGVLASGRVASNPSLMDGGQGEEAYERVPGKFSGPRLRVRIDIEHVLRPHLARQQVSADEVLASLPNLKFANATNFKLTSTQAAALDELVRGARPSHGQRQVSCPRTSKSSRRTRRFSRGMSCRMMFVVRYGRLRDRLDLYAARLADGLGRNVKLKPSVSHALPRDRRCHLATTVSRALSALWMRAHSSLGQFAAIGTAASRT